MFSFVIGFGLGFAVGLIGCFTLAMFYGKPDTTESDKLRDKIDREELKKKSEANQKKPI
mgnify:CR=1 FL=1